MALLQSFAHLTRKNLPVASDTVADVKDINAILAANLRFFMSREGAPYPNPHALGKAAGVAPNTIRNLLDPKRRTTTSSKPVGYPTLDKLLAISEKLGCDVWELLHPDIERSIRERDFYVRIQAEYDRLPKAPEKPSTRLPRPVK